MNIVEILRAQAARLGSSTAIVGGDGRAISFAGLERDSARVASLLERSGLRPGDAVLIFHPMSVELYTVLLAIFRLGLVAMFLDPSAGREHIERCCEIGSPRAYVASPKAHLLRFVSRAIRRIPTKFSVGAWLPGAPSLSRFEREAPREAVEACSPDAPALLTFTSGSTGLPKAAVRSHGFLVAQHCVLARTLSLEAGDVDLTTLPIFVLANLASGVTSVIPDADLRAPGRVDPAPVVEQIARRGVVSSAASPAFFERIVEHCEAHGLTLDGPRKLFTGGAPVFPRLLERLECVSPSARVVAVYGSTEAEPIAEIPWSEVTADDLRAMAEGRGLLAGPKVDEIDLRVVRDRWGAPRGPYTAEELDAETLPANEAGEIVVSGDHVLPGYLGGRGDEETKFRVDGRVWHRTGDAGYLDAAGRLWLLGRAAARVEDERGVLYPFAVETAVSGDPHIHRSAFVARGGRRVLAVELADPNAAFDAEALRRRLSWAEVDEVRVLSRIPVDKRHNAKIEYSSLYKMLDSE